MPLYKRLEDTIEEDEDDIKEEGQGQEQQVQQIVDEDGTWKKRYGDLRSHSQKQVNELNKRIRDLETAINTPTTNLPRTKEEVDAWAAKYPDVYDLLKTMINLDLQEVTASLNKRFEDVEADKQLNAKDAAINAIVAAHPDFYDLEKDENFHAWLGSKSQRTQAAIYENDTDSLAAIEVLDLYKLETAKKKGPGRPSNKDAAREVRVPSNRTIPSGSREDYDFSESQIEQMSSKEYDANEEAIDSARRNGRILMDLTGGAR